MEEITKNPGFQHITEKIFLTLCIRDLLACQLLNKNSKIILDNNPIFWIKKWISSGLSKNNQTGWIKAIQLTKHNTKCSSSILFYIKKALLKDPLVDVPCFIDEYVVEKFSTLAKIESGFEIEKYFVKAVKQMELGLIQILASKHPNLPKTLQEIYNYDVFHRKGKGEKEFLDIVQVLAPFIKDDAFFAKAFYWL